MAMIYFTIVATLCCLAHTATVLTSTRQETSGGLVRVPLLGKSVPAPWARKGRCMVWDSTKAPLNLYRKLDSSICETFIVPSRGFFHFIADTTMPLDPTDGLGIVRLYSGSTLLEWRDYYYQHEKTFHGAIKHDLWPDKEYKICFTGRDQSFNLCGMELYSCQFESACRRELSYFSTLSLSRRSQ